MGLKVKKKVVEYIDFDALRKDPARTIAAVCRINMGDLLTVLETHPGVYAYAVASLEVAKAREARVAIGLKRAEAATVKGLLSTDEKLAEWKARRLLVDNTEVRWHTDRLLRMQRRVGILTALVEALQTRRDMLIQLAARARSEYNATGAH